MPSSLRIPPTRSGSTGTMTAEHRRGHDAMYDALNRGHVDVPRLRQILAVLPNLQPLAGV